MKKRKFDIFKFLSIFLISIIIMGYFPRNEAIADTVKAGQNNADYLGNVTFYDYYGSNKIQTIGNNATETNNGYHYYFEKFNKAVSDYSRSKDLMYPLYFGDFNSSAGSSNNPEQKPESGQTLMGSAYKFFWAANRASRAENEDKSIINSKYTASVQGLVSDTLQNGNLVQDKKVIDFNNTYSKRFNISKINVNSNASYEDLSGKEILGRNNVLKLSYPGSSGTKDFRIELNCGNDDFGNTNKYLTFDLYNESNGTGGSVFIAIKDKSGNQMAGWSKFYGTEYYDNTIKSKDEKIWQTIVVDLDELKQNDNNKEHGTYNPKNVNLNSIQSIYIGYWGTDGGVFIDKSSIRFLGEIVDKTTGNVEVPYFNSEFLSGYEVGETTSEYKFPFKKRSKSVTDITGSKKIDTDYYIFSSGKSGYQINNTNITDVVRINKDTNHLDYWFDQQDNGSNVVLDMNGKEAGFGGTGDNEPGFFPFNQPSQSGKLDKPNSKQENGLNYGFGAKIQIDFKLTKDGTITVNNDKLPLEFNFKGDDDVWVYIDDQLALDMGGGHSQTEGNINFAKGKATVKNVVDGKITSNSLLQTVRTKSTELNLPVDCYIDGDITKGYDTDKIHTLTLFYMERGMVESNLYMDFNFIPSDNELIVEKEVDTSGVNEVLSNKTTEIANDIDFGFNVSENKVLKQNLDYKINVNGEVSDKTMNGDTFTLKHTNLATFYNRFTEGSNVVVNEKPDNRFSTNWITKDISDKNNEIVLGEGEGTIASEFRIPHSNSLYEKYIYYAKFINKIKTGRVSIYKEIEPLKEDNLDNYKDDVFDFKVTFTSILGNEIDPINYNGKYYVSGEGIDGEIEKNAVKIDENWVIQLKTGQTAEIRDIPINTKYKIEEILGDKYEVVIINGTKPDGGKSIVEGEITSSTDINKVTYMNKKKLRDVKLIKVDSSDSNIKLQGAEFTLNKLKEDGSNDENFEQRVTTTDETGVVYFKDLPYGKYILVETKSPTGYELLKEPITFNISENDKAIITIEIKNKKNIVLPTAGGSGITRGNYIGVMLIGLATVLYLFIIVRKKKYKFN